MGRQLPLCLYGKGIYKTKAGHLRYSSPKGLRRKYVHRVVIEKLIEETPWSIKILLPWPYEVHHMDYNKLNNQPENLLILSNAFHSVMTADRERMGNGTFMPKYHPKWVQPPAWLLFDDEVPF